MIETVKGVLEYLLGHDEDPWPELAKVGNVENPFLCHRVAAMAKREIISGELYDDAVQWIEKRIKGHGTLSGYHSFTWKGCVSVTSSEWPAIRRWYLEQWIGELTKENTR